jgi:tRNA U34 5-methylaminomethyl-2-thiouridine-forming methyltransferase MnmC
MRKVLTGDGSMTLFSERYGETYHSVSGAFEESLKKFAEPARVAEKSVSGTIKILDICFGLGYNSLVAIHLTRTTNPDCRIEITALEQDIGIIALMHEMPIPEEFKNEYTLLRRLANQALNNKKSEEAGVALRLLIGDALKTITIVEEYFDVVFLDPFSPKKNPELWTTDFLLELHKRMNKDAVLTTYSCASVVRNNLQSAGFAAKNGPCVGRKSPSTVAFPL